MATKGWLNLNGTFIEEKTPVIRADNRAFRYGDGLFETMKVIVGSIRLKEYHFNRLFSGMETMQIMLQGFVSDSMFEEQVMKTIRKNQIGGAARVRLTVYRGDGGLYDFNSTSAGYVIQVWPISSSSLAMNENGLKLGLYEGGKKAIDGLANIKSNNYLVYAMGAIHAKRYNNNDCLILNSENRVCDSTIANVFWAKDGTIFTPPLSEGCVAGVMRRHLVETLPEQGYNVVEKEVVPDELAEADEIFLTNAVSGVRWVSDFRNRKFGNTLSTKIFQSTIQ
jgi:branched-chain amino acid aminotransferase